MVSYTLFVGLAAVAAFFLASDPSSLGRAKPVLAPVLRLIPGYAGDNIANQWFRNSGLLGGDNLGDEQCRVVPGPEGCEDGQLHAGTHTVFAACTNTADRLLYWPPLHANNFSARQNPDYVLTYNLETDLMTRLKPVGYKGSLILHGMGMLETSQNTVRLFLIDHQSPRSCISIFDHTLGSETMEHVKTNCDALMTEPNDVTPVSKDSYYFTNMRHYNPRLGGIEAFMVHVEDALGPWDWTNVVFCGPQGCREVAKGIAGANGVLKVGDKLFVNRYMGAAISVYSIGANNDLTLVRTIPLGSPCDNLSYDAVNNAILVALFPDMGRAFESLANPDLTVPFAVGKIPLDTLQPELAMFSKRLTGAISIAVSDAELGKSFVAGILQRGVVICDRALGGKGPGIKLPIA